MHQLPLSQPFDLVLFVQDLPPLDELKITLPEDVTLEKIGTVASIIDLLGKPLTLAELACHGSIRVTSFLTGPGVESSAVKLRDEVIFRIAL